MKFVGAAVELVGAGLDLYVHRRPAGGSLLGVKRIGHDVYSFNGIRRRHVGNVLRQPRIGVLSTIDPRVIPLNRLPVDVSANRALWISRRRICLHRQPETWNDSVQSLKAAPLAGA